MIPFQPARALGKPPRVHLVGFADSRFGEARKRFLRQAENMGVFSSIYVVDETGLDSEFVERSRNTLRSDTKGFGFWIWKPQVILQRARQLTEGDIVLYLDIGFHLNRRGVHRFHDYVESLDSSAASLLVFQAFPEHSIKKFHMRNTLDLRDSVWCKGDLIELFKLRDAPVLSEPTIGAGAIFMKVDNRATELISTWKNLMLDHLELVNDSPSQSPNPPEFRKNRHDQSFFSLLVKVAPADLTIRRSAFQYWVPKVRNKKGADWGALRDFPFHAKRDLTKSRRRRLVGPRLAQRWFLRG